MSAVTAQRAESPLVLALDIGTSWVRGVLFDRLGRIVKGVEAFGMLPALEQAPKFIRGVCEPDLRHMSCIGRRWTIKGRCITS